MIVVIAGMEPGVDPGNPEDDGDRKDEAKEKEGGVHLILTPACVDVISSLLQDLSSSPLSTSEKENNWLNQLDSLHMDWVKKLAKEFAYRALVRAHAPHSIPVKAITNMVLVAGFPHLTVHLEQSVRGPHLPPGRKSSQGHWRTAVEGSVEDVALILDLSLPLPHGLERPEKAEQVHSASSSIGPLNLPRRIKATVSRVKADLRSIRSSSGRGFSKGGYPSSGYIRGIPASRRSERILKKGEEILLDVEAEDFRCLWISHQQRQSPHGMYTPCPYGVSLIPSPLSIY